MKDIFLVLGYGIPKNILTDENYNFYLKGVFNTIYRTVLQQKIKNPLIICSGGKTDCIKPFKRDEGTEMIKFFDAFRKREDLKKISRDWKIISERTSLSTLENLMNSKKIMQKKQIRNTEVTVFCEQTRTHRVVILTKKILKGYQVKVVPIDFDISTTRYLDPAFLIKKEAAVLKFDLWALQSPSNMKKYHKVFQEKFAFLRQPGHASNPQALQDWWKKKLDEIEKIGD